MVRTVVVRVVMMLVCALAFGYQPFATAERALKDKVLITGTSNVRDWTCNGDASVLVQPGSSAMSVPGLSTGIESATVTVIVKDIQCSEGEKMNEHLRKALKMKDAPEIRYQMTGYVLHETGSSVTIDGEMTIAGVKKPAQLKATIKPLAEGSVRIVGQVTFKMTDFNVKPPALMLGMLKVADQITVTFGATLRSGTKTAASAK